MGGKHHFKLRCCISWVLFSLLIVTLTTRSHCLAAEENDKLAATTENDSNNGEGGGGEDSDEEISFTEPSMINTTITTTTMSPKLSVSSQPSITTVSSSSVVNENKETENEEDEDEDDNDDEDITTNDKPIILRKSDKRKEEEKNEEDDEEEDEEEGDYDDTCDYSIRSFVRNFNFSTYLPDDHEELLERSRTEDIYNEIQNVTDTIEIIERLGKYVRKVQNNTELNAALMYIGTFVLDRFYEADIEPECSAGLLNVLTGIRKREMWALRFPDSFGNIPTGFLRGHISSFGEYDECIETKSPKMNNDEHIYGRYCQVQLRSFVPPLSRYTPQFETILREHPLYARIMTVAKGINLNNYLGGNLALKAMELIGAINNNVGHYGVCFPHTCSPRDIEKMYNSFLYPLLKLPVRVEERLCSDHRELQKVHLDGQQWTAIIGLITIGSIVALATLYHLYLENFVDDHHAEHQLLNKMDANNDHNHHLYYHNSHTNLVTSNNNDFNNNQSNNNTIEKGKEDILNLSSRLSPNTTTAIVTTTANNNTLSPPNNVPQRSIPQQFVLSFSAIANTNQLLKYDNRFAVLDTLRFLLTFAVYSLQAFEFTALFTLQMLRSITHTVPGELLWSNALWFARTPGIWIDGFMFTLGVTLIHAQFSRLKRNNGHFSYFLYVWKRWYRLSIAMLGTFFVLFIFPLVGDGPLWFINEQWLMPPCKNTKSIISSFLYYSNWNSALDNYKVEATFPICNPPTWFLSMSTQLYLVAPLIFLPLYRYPRFGVALTIFTIAISPLATASPRVFLGHPTYLEPTKFDDIRGLLRAFLNYHINPMQYFTALSVGLLTGYLIRCKPHLRVPGGRPVEFLLWCASFGSIISIFLWHNTFWAVNQINSELSTLGWYVCSKLMVSFALAYIAFMCCTGKGGVVNRFFTLRALQPVAKLSYSIYLLRVPTIFYRITSLRHTYELHYYKQFQNVIIDYSITTVLAYLLYILFEAPSINIMKIFEGEQLYKYFKANNNNNKDHDEVPSVVYMGTRKTTIDTVDGMDVKQQQQPPLPPPSNNIDDETTTTKTTTMTMTMNNNQNNVDGHNGHVNHHINSNNNDQFLPS